jgi:hypothetical protein
VRQSVEGNTEGSRAEVHPGVFIETTKLGRIATDDVGECQPIGLRIFGPSLR